MESRMKEYIAFDSHKHYTLMEREDRQTARTVQLRVAHQPGAIRACLRNCESGTDVAVEATGNWYWIVSEIEQAGLKPQLVHPQSQVDDGPDQQDRQIGCPRLEPASAQRNLAHGVDSAGRAARPAGIDPHAFGSGRSTHSIEEPTPIDPGQVWTGDPGLQRCLRNGGPKPVAGVAGAVA